MYKVKNNNCINKNINNSKYKQNTRNVNRPQPKI